MFENIVLYIWRFESSTLKELSSAPVIGGIYRFKKDTLDTLKYDIVQNVFLVNHICINKFSLKCFKVSKKNKSGS
jgi:hypothetical protein